MAVWATIADSVREKSGGGAFNTAHNHKKRVGKGAGGGLVGAHPRGSALANSMVRGVLGGRGEEELSRETSRAVCR